MSCREDGHAASCQYIQSGIRQRGAPNFRAKRRIATQPHIASDFDHAHPGVAALTGLQHR